MEKKLRYELKYLRIPDRISRKSPESNAFKIKKKTLNE